MRLAAVTMLVLLTVLSLPALVAADVVVDPSSIDKTIEKETVVNVTVRNTYDVDVSVTVSSSTDKITISPTTLSVPHNSERKVTLSLAAATYDGKVYYSWSYVASNVTHTGVVEQPIHIRLQYANVTVQPKVLKVSIPENESIEVPVAIINPSSTDVTIDVTWTGCVQDISDDYFTIQAHSSKVIFVELEGRLGDKNGEIRYKVHYPSYTSTVKQEVRVHGYRPSYVSQMEEELRNLQSMLYLPDRIKVEKGEARVNQPFEVKVLGWDNGRSRWVPIDRVIVGFEDTIKFTDSSGRVIFTPEKSGLIPLRVYDKLGNVKYEEIVNVSKSTCRLKLHDIEIGKPLHLELPEEGRVVVYSDDGMRIGDYYGKSINITVDAPGKYRVEYTSPSYEGSGVFFATAKLTITASVNGVALQPGAKVKPGDTIQFLIQYENGKLAKDCTVYISIPATAYGLDERMAMFMAMMNPDYFTPPFNIKSEQHLSEGRLTLIVPDYTSDKSGVITVSVEGNEFVDGAQMSLTVEPNVPLYAQRPVQAAGFAASVSLLAFVVAYRRDYFDIREKLAAIKSRLRRGEFDELGV